MEKIEGEHDDLCGSILSGLPQVECPVCGVTYHLYMNRKSIEEKGYCYPCSKQRATNYFVPDKCGHEAMIKDKENFVRQ